jgi:CDP-glycerol glycerophosphotransferase (TagB/SpsB family)
MAGDDVKLTIIVRAPGDDEASRRAADMAAGEAAGSGCACELVRWDPAGELDLATLKGEYLSVIDGGDYWEPGSLRVLISYLDAHKNDADAVFAHMRTAGAKRRPLEYRRMAKRPPLEFDANDRVAEIRPFFKGAAFRTDALRSAMTKVAPGPDGEICAATAAVLRRGAYARLSGAVLRYTELRALHRESADDTTARKLYDLSAKICGRFAPYAQAVALECLYYSLLRKETDLSLLSEISAGVIGWMGTAPGVKEYLLRQKYGDDALEKIRVAADGWLYLGETRVIDLSEKDGIQVSVIDVSGGVMRMDGLVSSAAVPEGGLYISDGAGERFACSVLPHPARDIVTTWGEVISHGRRFTAGLKLKHGAAYSFIVEDGHGNRAAIRPSIGPYARLNGDSDTSGFVTDGYRISFAGGKLKVRRSSAPADAKAELAYLADLVRRREFGVVFYRTLRHLRRPFVRKPVWLLGDRSQYAGDNAEHLFRYLMKIGADKKYDIRFVISRDSRDYERMKTYGRVLPFDTVAHRVMFLLADKVILSIAHYMGINPFSAKRPYYEDLYSFDYVYLRHGVAKDDQSIWLNKLNKNMRMLVTVSGRERDAILGGDYCYDESVVKLTGLPRFDGLTDDSRKVIAVLPTWRRDLEGKKIPASPKRQYRKDFKASDFFTFYNTLINDDGLLAVMRQKGYTGKFYLHPVFEAQVGDFHGNDVFEVGASVADYQSVFRESSLMLTDFSSVAFDFAYLKKPVIYAQPDEEKFYENHAWGRGYFSYPDDGFGPVTRDYGETVRAMISYIEKGCVMEQKYVERVDGFFAYTDRENCRRVFEAIEAIGATETS